MSALDVGFGNQGKHTVAGFQQGRVAPADVPTVCRLEGAAEGSHRLLLVGSRQRKEFFVGICPLLNPSLRTLGYSVCRELFRKSCVLHSLQLVAESDAVVVKPYHEGAHPVFIGRVRTMQPFAAEHGVVFLYLAYKLHLRV